MLHWIDRVRAFGQVPVPDAARKHLAAWVALTFVVCGASILTLLSPSIPAPPQSPAPPLAQAPAAPDPATPTAAPERVTVRDIRAAKRAARRFLAGGYLEYAYGSPPGKIATATAELRQALAENPPRVPPAIRRRHARILTMQTEDAQPGVIPVLVTLTDDVGTTSSLTVRAERRGHRWVITDIAA